jgi:hypothetical protein
LDLTHENAPLNSHAITVGHPATSSHQMAGIHAGGSPTRDMSEMTKAQEHSIGVEHRQEIGCDTHLLVATQPRR